jgi:hypothetical protein
LRPKILFALCVFGAVLAAFATAAALVMILPLFNKRTEVTSKPNLWKSFDSSRAAHSITALSEITPRFAGSNGSHRAREYLVSELTAAGWQVAEQRFRGPSNVSLVNLLAHTGPIIGRRPRLLLASNYDGPRSAVGVLPASSTSAAGAAILLEVARTLAASPRDSTQLEIVFLDGNEPLAQYAPDDGLAGARFYAQRIGRTKPFEAAIILATLGGRGTTLALLPHSDQRLADELSHAAEATGREMNISSFERRIWTAQLPIGLSNIPSLALTSVDDTAAYTADDTPDHIDTAEIERCGCSIVEWVQWRLGKAGAK